MNVQQTLYILLNAPSRKSILIKGPHGIGKSQVVAQAAAEMSRRTGKPYGFIDFRLAQCEVGDLIGMMRHEEVGKVSRQVFKDGVKISEEVTSKNVTIHDIADWFPQDPDSCGFLFLDELFRANRDLQNAVMELALDGRYHFKELPIGWKVISAANDNMDIYSGTFPDPALYDRFLKIDFKPTTPEWMAHAKSIGTHKAVTGYIHALGEKELFPPENMEPGRTYPSPRAWINLSDWIKDLEEKNQDPLGAENQEMLTMIAAGYVGSTIALAFVNWIKTNYKVYTADQLLNKFTDEMEADIKAMDPTEVTYYSDVIIDHVKDKNLKLTSKQQNNLLRFYKVLPKEAASGFWSKFSAECRDVATAWYKDCKGVMEYTFSFLSKKEAMKGFEGEEKKK